MRLTARGRLGSRIESFGSCLEPIAVNIEIMRAFVELGRVAGSFQELQKMLDQIWTSARGSVSTMSNCARSSRRCGSSSRRRLERSAPLASAFVRAASSTAASQGVDAVQLPSG